MNKNIMDKLTEAYMHWQREAERGDPKGKIYFKGGCDSIIMLAQMFGFSEEWIQNDLIGKSAVKTNSKDGGKE